ncbi:MAG: pyridoxal phosphate-dependent aminotransferase [Candidatus Bathyarchaeia archaeon]
MTMREFTHAMGMDRIGTETAFEVQAEVERLGREGRRIIKFHIGDPDFDTPDNIKERAKKALDGNKTHYTGPRGIYELRKAIVDRISERTGVEYTPDECIVMVGAKQCIFNTILAYVDQGDEVIIPNPGWSIYESVVNFAGGRPILIPLKEENGFRLDMRDLEEGIRGKKRLKMIILNSPNNPTGSILEEDDLEEITDLAVKRNMMVLSDEVYEEIIYDREHLSIAGLPGMRERTIRVSGFSKTYAMTGWRLGYATAPQPIIDRIERIAINATSCPVSFCQWAAVEALTGPQDAVGRMVGEFRRRRDYMLDGFGRIRGFSCLKPEGTFYMCPNIKGLGMKSDELARYLLYEAGVSTLPGTSFGEYGEGYLRFSYATSMEDIKEGLDRIRALFGR